MRVTITYIHHNCFVLRTPHRTFLFDYPGQAHLPDEADALVRRAVAGTRLAVFISHGHDDHMHHDLASVTTAAAEVVYVLSDDVTELRPEAVPGNGAVTIVEGEACYVVDDMDVQTLASNDLGVAYLVDDAGLRFFFGGDLAEWIWPGAPAREAAFTRDFFRRSMERARDFRPQVVFADTDPRLANLAGGPEACRIIGAPVFVPMHAFGDSAALAGFGDALGGCGSSLFLYGRSGDETEFTVST
jgi:glyoxylase-like metal-dependent hydrolase (beta-lactamase superfamily II)